MERKFDKRILDLKSQNKDLKKLLNHSDAFIESKFNPAISKSFSESISLAVIQVNGCKLCSYAHTKSALKSGMNKEDIEFLLSGSFDDAPEEQLEALLFAQHYADTHGNPDPELEKKLLETYGEEKTRDIRSSILLMMVSNLHGNTMEALKLRLQGKRVEGSGFWMELAVTLNLFKIAPVFLYKIVKFKLSGKKRERTTIAFG